MDFPNDDNGQLLQEMHEAGLDLTIPRDIDFFLIFRTKKDAEAMIAAVTEASESTQYKLEKNEIHGDWDLCCTNNMIPSYENITKTEKLLIELAEKHNGQDDGWGVMEEDEDD